MVDSTFELERPARALRKGLSLFHQNSSNDSVPDMDGTTGDLKPAKVQGHRGAGDPNDPSTTNAALSHDEEELRNTSAHTFYLRTSERKMRLVAKTERQQDQFIASIERMLAKTIWAGKNRFDSFAPIRLNVAAQWLIDGVSRAYLCSHSIVTDLHALQRDYYWSLSRAIALAKHKILCAFRKAVHPPRGADRLFHSIHDWWLSPELYLRRPPALNGELYPLVTRLAVFSHCPEARPTDSLRQ